jgi:phosphoglucomutase
MCGDFSRFFDFSAISDDMLCAAVDSLVLSASGWRGVFAAGGGDDDESPVPARAIPAVAVLMADSFADYLESGVGQDVGQNVVAIVGRDTRPTGEAVASAMMRAFAARGIPFEYIGVAAAPEIMAYARGDSGTRFFAYVSASHNPVAHNGVKFGGASGVLDGREEKKLREIFVRKCREKGAVARARLLVDSAASDKKNVLEAAIRDSPSCKRRALEAYLSFAELCAGGRRFPHRAAVVADLNGSARCESIDRVFFESRGIGFFPFNDTLGVFSHGMVPEGGNLEAAARFLEDVRKKHPETVLAYACDCDGDRGNIVYFDEKTGHARLLSAQEVFALCVMSELCGAGGLPGGAQKAVACNCPTSMRVDDIADAAGARVFRAEVGEANVVSLSDIARREGFDVRVSGEGSNGGNITHPARVRDPLNTVSALLSLVAEKNAGLSDIASSLPAWTTTEASDGRAMLDIASKDHAALKRAFQKEFLSWWESNRRSLSRNGLESWTAIATNGTAETRGIADFGESGTGGLKILFSDGAGKRAAFMWMRGSGTERVFRVMCDVRGNNPALESMLLDAERAMLLKADESVA